MLDHFHTLKNNETMNCYFATAHLLKNSIQTLKTMNIKFRFTNSVIKHIY